MKVTVTALGAVRSTLAYFLHEAGYAPREDDGAEERARYYARDTGEHLHASAWFGCGAEALGLIGRVCARDFERVLRGEVLGTDVVLRRHRDGAQEHRSGWDLTFSAPKSVSVAWGVQGDGRVLCEFVESVKRALRALEARYLETRVYDRETRRRERVPADGLVAATFVHVSNRRDEPQLHLHAVMINMTRSAQGWRSVEPSAFLRHARLLGTLAGDALARGLRGLGYGIEARRLGRAQTFEIAGYPRWVLDHFSTRRRELLRHLAETGRRVSARALQAAAFATRADKSGLRTPALRAKWRAETDHNPRLKQALEAALYRSQRAESDEAPAPTALETVSAAVAHLGERTALLRERDILATALMLAPGRHGPDVLKAALEQRLRDRHLLPARAYRGGGRAFVATRELADERALVAWMKAGRDVGRALACEDAVAAWLETTCHTAGQKAALRLILLAPHRAVAVQGFAGTGKTTMLREMVSLAEGVPVFGLAPSAAAARVLGHEAGFSTRTLDWFLTRFASVRTGQANAALRALARELCADGILVVDESSMLSTTQLRALTHLTDRIGVARVVLCGDHRQLQSVRPGQPFRLLQEAGLPTAVMDEIVRQRNPVIRKAVRDALSGRPARALARLAERIEEVPAQALAETAAREFLALPDAQRSHTLLVAPTNALRRDINAVVREGLAEEGRIRGPALVVQRLIDMHLSATQKAELSSYEPGDEVAFVQDLLHYRVRNAEACVVTGIAGERVALLHPDGKPRHIAPAGRIRYRIKVCESAPIELRAGDRIRWTNNDHRRGLLNGENAAVERIGKHAVTLRTEGGAKHVLDATDPQLRHIDHAYATTAHAAQGSTCDRVIAVLDADPMPLTNQLTFYVQISRAREEVVLLTDDREQLLETLEEQSGERMSAHEALGAMPEGGGAAQRMRRRRYERMRRQWRQVRRRARRERCPERYAQGYAAVREQAERLDGDDALPDYMRRFVDDWLGDHDRTERERQNIETVVDAARRLGREPSEGRAEDAHEKADAAASGDDDATEALALARTVAEDTIAYGPHLDADESLRRAFEAAHPVLEAAALAGACESVRRQAENDRTIAFYVPGHEALVAHATHLEASEPPLDTDTRALVSEVLQDNTRRRTERGRIERFLACAARRAAVRDSNLTWTPRDAALHRRAVALASDRDRYAAHFQAQEDLRGRLDSVHAGLETAAFRTAYQRIERLAAQAGRPWHRVRGFPSLLEHAARLSESLLPLDGDTRTLATWLMREDDERRARALELTALCEQAERRHRLRTQGSPWVAQDDDLLRRARAVQNNEDRYRPHFADVAFLRARFNRVRAVLEKDKKAAEPHKAGRSKDSPVSEHSCALDYESLARSAMGLRFWAHIALDADAGDEEYADEQARNAQFPPTGQRVLVELFEWMEFVQMERERKAEHQWTVLDEALVEVARFLGGPAGSAGRLFANEETRNRFDSAHAGLETAAFRSAYQRIERLAAHGGRPRHRVRGYRSLLEHATRLSESLLPLDADTRALATRLMREDDERRARAFELTSLCEQAERRHRFRSQGSPWAAQDDDLLRRAQAVQNDEDHYRPDFADIAFLRARFNRVRAVLEKDKKSRDICAAGRSKEDSPALEHSCALDYESLAGLARALLFWAHVAPDADAEDEESADETARIAQFPPTGQRVLVEFFEWVEFVRMEREREAEYEWTVLDEAIVEVARFVGGPSRYAGRFFADEETHDRFAQVHAELEARALQGVYDTVEREIRERNTIRDYAPSYRNLIKQAKTLQESTLELPDYTRTLIGRVMDHEIERLRELDFLRGILNADTRWRDAGSQIRRWSTRDESLLSRAREVAGDTGRHAHHLEANEGWRPRFVETWTALEVENFRSTCDTVDRQAEKENTIAFYASGYAYRLEAARNLQSLDVSLPEDACALAATVVQQENEYRQALRDIDEFISNAQTWDSGRSENTQWREGYVSLARRQETIAAHDSKYRLHLEADENLRRRFQRSAANLEGRALRAEAEVVDADARGRGTLPCYAPPYADLLRHARRICDSRLPLTKADRGLAAAIVQRDAGYRRDVQHIEEFLDHVASWRKSPERDQAWKTRGGDLLRRARAIAHEDGDGRYGPHLVAVESMRTRLESAHACLKAAAQSDARAPKRSPKSRQRER